MAIGNLKRLFGTGPRGVAASLAVLLAATWLDRLTGHPRISNYTGIMAGVSCLLAAMGVALLLWSSWTLRTWWFREELCTKGPFKWFRHPLYAAWITFLLPAAALYADSWIMLATAALLHPLWHRLVRSEETMMFEQFGDDYRHYAARTGRFFPRILNR
jgi:protein-S-isoprenylcysteine O-methyltransferase Ste14